jgi:hypothetical protein
MSSQPFLHERKELTASIYSVDGAAEETIVFVLEAQKRKLASSGNEQKTKSAEYRHDVRRASRFQP